MATVNIRFPGSLCHFDGDYDFDPGQTWYQKLEAVLGDQLVYLFNPEAKPTAFVVYYLNELKQDDIAMKTCLDKDKLLIVSAISGG